MDQCISGTGKMIIIMAKAFTFIPMERDTKANLRMELSVDLERCTILLGTSTRGTGKKAKRMVQASRSIQTVKSMWVNGGITKDQGKENSIRTMN